MKESEWHPPRGYNPGRASFSDISPPLGPPSAPPCGCSTRSLHSLATGLCFLRPPLCSSEHDECVCVCGLVDFRALLNRTLCSLGFVSFSFCVCCGASPTHTTSCTHTHVCGRGAFFASFFLSTSNLSVSSLPSGPRVLIRQNIHVKISLSTVKGCCSLSEVP